MATNQAFTIANYHKSGDDINLKLEGGLLAPGEGKIIIQGGDIAGLTNGEITDINVVVSNGPVWQYQIMVIGNTTLIDHWSCEFTDAAGDTYKLRISSRFVENHNVSYNSVAPGIVSISLKQTGPWPF